MNKDQAEGKLSRSKRNIFNKIPPWVYVLIVLYSEVGSKVFPSHLVVYPGPCLSDGVWRARVLEERRI